MQGGFYHDRRHKKIRRREDKGNIKCRFMLSGIKRDGRKWLAAEGTTDEKAVTEAYLQELSEDVLPIDALISFASSEKGAEVFGAEQAKSMAEAGKASKANGGKYCICPACSAGGAILDKKNEIL